MERGGERRRERERRQKIDKRRERGGKGRTDREPHSSYNKII